MAEIKVGTVTAWRQLSSILALFRLAPEPGSRFPDYTPGQYIALRREGCRLTRRVTGEDGRPGYVPEVDEHGNPKRGPVTHSYSISSAPFETTSAGELEFYVVLETTEEGLLGRLTESMFQMRPTEDNTIEYVDRIVGDFTLQKRAQGFRNVLLVGTGTGLAPFVSMVKQLHFDAAEGSSDGVRYTLLHTNRTREELAYHDALTQVEAAASFDFLYIPSVSRPAPSDLEDAGLGVGRANNVLRHIFEMPLKEEEDLRATESRGGDVASAKKALDRAVRPALPRRLPRADLLRRLSPGETVVLTCGNAWLMADIKTVAGAQGMRFEKEDW